MSIYDDYAKYLRAGGATTQSQSARDALAGMTYGSNGSRNSGGGDGGQSPLEWGIDIISRPLYAVMGRLTTHANQIGSASQRAIAQARAEGKVGENTDVWGLINSLTSDYDPGKTIEAAWNGFWSTNPEDKKTGVDLIDEMGTQIAGIQGDTYEAPTFENIDEGNWGDFFAALGRGAGSFALDVAGDPLTYGTLGLGKVAKWGMQGARAIIPGARTAKVAESAAASGAREAVTGTERSLLSGLGREAGDVGESAWARAGAANVADPSSAGRALNAARQADSGSTFARVSNASAAKLPKVSDTISSHHSGIVNAILKTNRELDKAATSTKAIVDDVIPTPKKPSAKGTGAPAVSAGGGKSLGDFARTFFRDAADESLGRVRLPGGGPTSELFPSNIVNQLSRGNTQSQLEYLNRLVNVAKGPQGTPELRRFLTEAQQFWRGQTPARGGAAAAPAAQAAEVVAQQAPEAVSAANRADLLNSILKKPSGKPTELGKELRAALGDKLFRQLSSTAGGPAASATRARVLDELTQLARNADELSPSTFDGMHENVRHFVEDRMHLRREDFDLVARQKLLDRELAAMQPRVTNPKTARAVDPQTLRGAEAATGRTARELANRYDAQAKRIAGDYFDPKKGKWEGGNFTFKTEDGRRYVIEDGNIGTHAFTTWADGARKTIDDAIPPVKNAKTGYEGIPAQLKTRVRREQLPAALREVEEALAESGIPMGVKLGDDLVMIRPSYIYDSVNDAVIAARQAGGPLAGDAAAAVQRQADVVLFNPGTAVPDSLLYEAYAAAIRGADDAALDAILARTKSVYNGVEIKRQPLGAGRNGGQYLRNKYSAEQLRGMTIDLIRRTSDGVAERGQSIAREYFEKSVTDASAMATKIETDVAEAFARGDGPGMAELANIERNLVQLAKDYGASGHGVGLAAEELSRQLPPWAVRRAQDVRATQTAFVNAARAGKTADEMRAMGAASEVRHTPVEMNAAYDDVSDLLNGAEEAAGAAGETLEEMYGIGTGVIRQELQAKSLWEQMLHPMRTKFDAQYGAGVDGIDMLRSTREALGSSAKDIYYRSIDISNWGRKYEGLRLGESTETAATAAWKMMQQGLDEVPAAQRALPNGELVAQALEELRPIANYYFDTSRVGLMGDRYWRAGSQNIRYLERSMATAGLTKKYGNVFDDGLLDGTVQDWWRKVDVESPTEFLQQYNTAMHHALGERVAMTNLIDTLKRSGLLSTTHKPGFAKPKLEGDSFFYAGLHESGAFIDTRVLDAMSNVDKKLYAARSFGENSFGSTVFDPILGAWKTAMTIMRPGHHVRNTLSNGMLSFVDQGIRNLGKSGDVALRIMARRQGDQGLEGLSELERLLSGAQSGLKKGGDDVVYSTTAARGRKVELTMDDLNNAFSERGGWRTYMQSEDIVRGRGRVQRAADAVTMKNNVIGRTAGAVSEATDHYGYLQHFIQITMNNARKVGTAEFKTLDDLYNYAIERAYRFHPDSNVLTPFEAKYIRRVIPFYTWFRGTLPAVIESSLKHPGRVAVAHKASYNIAEMFGLDPESYANPWSEDMEVPEYLREGVFGANAIFGGQAYVLTPGFAHQDLARMFFGRGPEEGGNGVTATLSNAARSLMGMVNPMFRMPVELATGRKLETGTQIRQAGDYIDDSIPFLNYLSGGTGISFTETLLNLPKALEQGRPIERWNVQQGYQPSIFDEGIGEHQHRRVLNWLFGQGAQPVERGGAGATGRSITENASQSPQNSSGGSSTPQSGGSGASGAASSGSGTNAPVSSGDWRDIPLPAELDPASARAMQEVVEGYTNKNMTPSQLMSVMRDMQADDLRRQSAMNYSDYAQGAFQQLAAENPDATISELLAMARYMYPNTYKKTP